ncbi:MAG: BlaI/MecI/CopY family transcriptional regulator [Sedimentisphaerales bacterium]|nr:BlaI/MecI/CopY family transcriptional regulator [Sedimentisphaerales bacterium]
MKKDKITISPSEWEVIEVLWEQSPLSASEIFDALKDQTTWNNRTVRSFLDRLEQKEAVAKEKKHGVNVYKPLLKREQCLRKESRSFLERFFSGNPVSMMSHFIEKEKLSSEQIEKLQKLLETKQKNDKK